MSGRKVSVLGAGPAGLGAALNLARRGVGVEVYERAAEVGGLARSIPLWGQNVEFGAHLLLLEDPRIAGLWRELFGRNYLAAPRDTRIITEHGEFVYPYRPLQVINQLGARRTAECVFGMVRRPRGDGVESLEDWIVARFGQPAFEALLSDYCLKHFGRPAGEIDADLAGSLLGFRRQPSVVSILGSLMRRTPEPPVVKPIGGVGELMKRMREEVVRHGGRVHLNADIEELRVEDGQIRFLRMEGTDCEVDDVLSTVPLGTLIRLLRAPPNIAARISELESRNVILAFTLCEGPPPFDGQWTYIADSGSPVGRVTNFSGWLPPGRLPSQTILCFEFWCGLEEPLWQADEDVLSRLAAESLRRVGIEPGAFLATKVIRKANAFPVPHLGYGEKLRPVTRWIEQIEGLKTSGRFGAFVNSGVHESILLGMDAADALLARPGLARRS